jgi:hypothetical protein
LEHDVARLPANRDPNTYFARRRHAIPPSPSSRTAVTLSLSRRDLIRTRALRFVKKLLRRVSLSDT